MLLWEALTTPLHKPSDETTGESNGLRPIRLPFDKRCAALTKAGRRCRGRIREGTEFCPFHDPTLSLQRRRSNASKDGRTHRRWTHLPDGYLRKLSNRTSIGQAMDRLYREVRLGTVTPEMGHVLFHILCRLLDSGLQDDQRPAPRSTRRSKAERIRPRLDDLLTHTERAVWRKAVANAPATFLRTTPEERARATIDSYQEALAATGKNAALPAAS